MCQARCLANLDGIILHWQTEAIPANWMVDIVPLLALEASLDVSKLEGPAMTDVNTCTGNSWQHTQAVILRFCAVGKISDVRPLTLPGVLPFLFNISRVVSLHTCQYITDIW